jgi:hypothetical protein
MSMEDEYSFVSAIVTPDLVSQRNRLEALVSSYAPFLCNTLKAKLKKVTVKVMNVQYDLSCTY